MGNEMQLVRRDVVRDGIEFLSRVDRDLVEPAENLHLSGEISSEVERQAARLRKVLFRVLGHRGEIVDIDHPLGLRRQDGQTETAHTR